MSLKKIINWVLRRQPRGQDGGDGKAFAAEGGFAYGGKGGRGTTGRGGDGGNAIAIGKGSVALGGRGGDARPSRRREN